MNLKLGFIMQCLLETCIGIGRYSHFILLIFGAAIGGEEVDFFSFIFLKLRFLKGLCCRFDKEKQNLLLFSVLLEW
jgi:hypothetical protein